jgi:hypothetical protein
MSGETSQIELRACLVHQASACQSCQRDERWFVIDWEHESAALEVIRHAERRLGTRFGGAWMDRRADCINVALVRPSHDDERMTHELGGNTPWRVRLVEVQFSRADLLATLGWSPEHNCVVAEFRRIDEDAIGFLRQRVPAGALRIEIDPGAPYGVALGRRELQDRI